MVVDAKAAVVKKVGDASNTESRMSDIVQKADSGRSLYPIDATIAGTVEGPIWFVEHSVHTYANNRDTAS